MPTARSSTPAPLPGCTPLFDSAGLREADRRAGEDHAMPSILLMERAGLQKKKVEKIRPDPDMNKRRDIDDDRPLRKDPNKPV